MSDKTIAQSPKPGNYCCCNRVNHLQTGFKYHHWPTNDLLPPGTRYKAGSQVAFTCRVSSVSSLFLLGTAHDLDTLEECLSVWVWVVFRCVYIETWMLEESPLSGVLPLRRHRTLMCLDALITWITALFQSYTRNQLTKNILRLPW